MHNELEVGQLSLLPLLALAKKEVAERKQLTKNPLYQVLP